MADETIRIGFVGASANTRLRHLPGFEAITGLEVVSAAPNAGPQRFRVRWQPSQTPVRDASFG